MIEYSFVIGKLVSRDKGKVLDVGCVARLNPLPATLASIGWEVYGIDMRQFKFRFPNFHFVPGDITSTDFPDGFFDATEGGMEYLHFVKGMEVYELDQFFDDFYRPGLLGEVLSGKQIK